MMVLVRGYTNAEGSERWMNDNQMKTIQYLPWAIHRSASVTLSAAILWCSGTGSKIQQQMLRHLANFKMSLTLTVFFSLMFFFLILTNRFFLSSC